MQSEFLSLFLPAYLWATLIAASVQQLLGDMGLFASASAVPLNLLFSLLCDFDYFQFLIGQVLR